MRQERFWTDLFIQNFSLFFESLILSDFINDLIYISIIQLNLKSKSNLELLHPKLFCLSNCFSFSTLLSISSIFLSIRLNFVAIDLALNLQFLLNLCSFLTYQGIQNIFLFPITEFCRQMLSPICSLFRLSFSSSCFLRNSKKRISIS